MFDHGWLYATLLFRDPCRIMETRRSGYGIINLLWGRNCEKGEKRAVEMGPLSTSDKSAERVETTAMLMLGFSRSDAK